MGTFTPGFGKTNVYMAALESAVSPASRLKCYIGDAYNLDCWGSSSENLWQQTYSNSEGFRLYLVENQAALGQSSSHKLTMVPLFDS